MPKVNVPQNNGKGRQNGNSGNGAGASGARPGKGKGAGNASRVSRVLQGHPQVLLEVAQFVGRYVVLPWQTRVVVGAWVGAAWLVDVWGRLPLQAVLAFGGVPLQNPANPANVASQAAARTPGGPARK